MSDVSPGTIRSVEAADWLVRSALPEFLAVVACDDDAAWFRALPPFDGLTGRGTARGWRGAHTRACTVRDTLRAARDRGYERLWQSAGSIDLPRISIEHYDELVPYAYQCLNPTQLGWVSAQAMAAAVDFARVADVLLGGGDSNPPELTDAWQRSCDALTDRTRLRALQLDPAPTATT